MAFTDEIQRYIELNEQAAGTKDKIKEVAESLGLSVEENVDTMDSVLEKIKIQPRLSLSMVQKENGAFRLTVTKE